MTDSKEAVDSKWSAALKGFIQYPVIILIGVVLWLQSDRDAKRLEHQQAVELLRLNEQNEIERQRLVVISDLKSAVEQLAKAADAGAENTASLETALALSTQSEQKQSEELLEAMKFQERSREERAKSYNKLADVLERLLMAIRMKGVD